MKALGLHGLALASVALSAGCFFDPDPPDGGGSGGGDGGIGGTCLVVRDLPSSIVVRASGGSMLVQAGRWNSTPSLVIHDPGPRFDIDCPDQVIPLADVAGPNATMLDIVPVTTTTFLVLRVNGALDTLFVQRVSRDEPTVQPYLQIGTTSASPVGALAYAPGANPSILIATGDKAWTASDDDLGAAYTPMPGLVADDELIAAGTLPAGGVAPWILIGRRNLYTASGAAGAAPTLPPVSTPNDSSMCVSQPVSSCPSRRRRSGFESEIYPTGTLTFDRRGMLLAKPDLNPEELLFSETLFPGSVLDAVPAYLDSSDVLVLTTEGSGPVLRDKNGTVLVENTDPAANTIEHISVGEFLGNGQRQAIMHARYGAVLGTSRCVELTGPNAGDPCGI